MKAYNLHGIDDLRYENIAEPELKEGWALVRVKNSGICSSDIPRIFTKGTYHFPTVPGHEFSGIVEKVNGEEYAAWVGKRVGVFPLIPCRQCRQCRAHHYEMCEHYDYIGSRRDGAFSEFVAVPVWNLLELPENIPFRLAAMLEPLSVALHAVNKLNVKADDTVAVIGTGMIGFAAAQWAKYKGASRVCVIGRTPEKKRIADQLNGIDYILQEDAVSNSFTKVVEAVGSNTAILVALDLAMPEGTIVLTGNPAGDIALEQNAYWKVLRKQLVLVGTWNSTYEEGAPSDWTEGIRALETGAIHAEPLISHCFPQEKLKEALSLMKNHTEMYCKVMVDWNEK